MEQVPLRNRHVHVSSKEIRGCLTMKVHLFSKYPYKTTRCGKTIPHLFGNQSHKEHPNVGIFNKQTIFLKSNHIAPDRHYLCGECFNEKDVVKFMQKEVIRFRSAKQIKQMECSYQSK
jgi:predicted nucleic acid-binding Zn ribbon protein